MFLWVLFEISPAKPLPYQDDDGGNHHGNKNQKRKLLQETALRENIKYRQAECHGCKQEESYQLFHLYSPRECVYCYLRAKIADTNCPIPICGTIIISFILPLFAVDCSTDCCVAILKAYFFMPIHLVEAAAITVISDFLSETSTVLFHL